MPTIPYKNAKGERIPGVTTIISENCGWAKRGLMYWAWDCGMHGLDYKQQAEKAGNAGTIAHYLVECDLKNIKPDTSKEDPELVKKSETSFLNYLEWKDNMKFEIVE